MNNTSGKIDYPVGIQNFPKLREMGYLYVDKTALLYKMVEKGGYFFLSRPRRFGKSLMISTLEAYYQGRRELFIGLALDSLTDDWNPHPVLHLDLSPREYRDRQSLVDQLTLHLERWEREYHCEMPSRSPEERFGNVIRHAYEATGKKVAILIDEYDKPMLSAVSNEELAEEYRSLLKAFYSNLKAFDGYIEIGVLTGVARFSKVSIFSDLNNLRDISFEEGFASICGVTAEELTDYFNDGMVEFAERQHVSLQEIKDDLRRKYDGYHFAKISPDIYNPYSLMSAFAKKEMGPYWVEHGTPEYLVSMIEDGGWLLPDIAPVEIDADYLQSAGLLSRDPIPSLFQTGYLTIKKYDEEFNTYLLDYPNEEVRNGFAKSLVPYFIVKSTRGASFSVQKFVKDITTGQIERFMRMMEELIAGVPYSEKGSAEAHFQNACYLLFTLMGQYVKLEDRTSDGRIDLSVETARYVYIFEFKVDSTAEEALAQIKRKQYWLKYRGSGKQIRLIGANFDTNTRRLSGYLIEEE